MMEGEADETSQSTAIQKPLHEIELPPLSHCIKSFIQFASLHQTSNAKDHAEIFSASLAFLGHLKTDQLKLFQDQRGVDSHPNRNAFHSHLNRTPAINVVLEDESIFQSLLQMLSPKEALSIPHLSVPVNSNRANNIPSIQPNNNSSSQNIRKRAYSDADNTISQKKQKKLTASGSSSNLSSIISLKGSGTDKYDSEQRIFALSVLFTCMRHLDHWPATLVKAYAEDCFGERYWVDDELCQDLVANLSAVHTASDISNEILDTSTLDLARLFANHHSNHIDNPEAEVASILPSKLKLNNKLQTSSYHEDTRNKDPVSDSDSGDEEMIVEEMSVSSNSNKVHNINSHHSLLELNASSKLVQPMEQTCNEERIKRKNYDETNKPLIPKEIPVEKNQKITERHLNLEKIRPRYVGENKLLAHRIIVEVLSCRLQSKTRHYSQLLTTLKDFITIPRIRSLIAQNLERWLQSPALSGLARTLFSSIVKCMENNDPALKEDIHAIDSILSMQLKANQLTTHIENITSIAKTIPTPFIYRHIFMNLLIKELSNTKVSSDSTAPSSFQSSDMLKMFVAVHGVVAPKQAADALAYSILNLAFSSNLQSSFASPNQFKMNINQICILFQNVSKALGQSYDGCAILESVLRIGKEKLNTSVSYNNIIARFAFECILLIVPQPTTSTSNPSSFQHRSSQKSQQRQRQTLEFSRSSRDSISPKILEKLMAARKTILNWCVSEYASIFESAIFSEESILKDEKDNKVIKKRPRKRKLEDEVPFGAGSPQFSSVLDGQSNIQERYSSFKPVTYSYLATISSLLFLDAADDDNMKSFLCLSDQPEPDILEALPDDAFYRIRFCSAYGADLDDEIINIILKSALSSEHGITRIIAIEIIEGMVLKCKLNGSSVMKIESSDIVWNLYDLTEYSPRKETRKDFYADKSNELGEEISLMNKDSILYDEQKLSYPGQWWRVTATALILCGSSPENIGLIMWESHPTLKALIKMTVSGRYRFPTADCNNEEREVMKNNENHMKDEEFRVAERLFLPDSMKSTNKTLDAAYEILSPKESQLHLRISKRQREKQEKELQRKKEAAAEKELADIQKRKKILRTAQKSIMLLDPYGFARKPPKESINLLLQVDNVFGLSECFRRCSTPDFLMLTIGGNSRDYIERAYDWLIPIISSSQHLIHRLPPSASCFLLLRAYGTDGSQQNSQLLELVAPLLEHVSKCLNGELGKFDAKRAANLLLSDLADASPDRRRCARRVLQEAIGIMKSEDNETNRTFSVKESWVSVASQCRCDWLFNLLHVKFALVLVQEAIKFLSHALAYERGRVLSSYALALCSFISFAKANEIDELPDFVTVLCNLLSARPQVCDAAMETCPSFRDMGIDIIHDEWKRVVLDTKFSSKVDDSILKNEVKVYISGVEHASEKQNDKPMHVFASLPLLHAAILLLSSWKKVDEEDYESDLILGNREPDNKAVLSLAKYLILASKASQHDDIVLGLAGATINGSKRAITIEHWVSLAKSRCAYIARHAALSAPLIFLPRIILCCGLPRSSLFTILGRLGELGDESKDCDRTFRDLLSPSSVSELGLGVMGNRRAIARKLLGRISAYLRIYRSDNEKGRLDLTSLSFVLWLHEECQTSMNKDSSSKRNKGRKLNYEKVPSVTVESLLQNINKAVTSIEETSPKHMNSIDADSREDAYDISHEVIIDFDGEKQDSARNEKEIDIQKFFNQANDFEYLESKLGKMSMSKHIDNHQVNDAALKLLSIIREDDNIPLFKERFIIKWIPLLTQISCSPLVWQKMFELSETRNNQIYSVINRCIELWSDENILKCQKWILSETQNSTIKGSYLLFSSFLLMSSNQESIHQEINFDQIDSEKPQWMRSNADIRATISLALDCAKKMSLENINCSSVVAKNSTRRLYSRNMLPDWLILLLIIAKYGKKFSAMVTNQIIENIEDLNFDDQLLYSTLLRVYTYFPMHINLGDAIMRKALLQAASSYTDEWKHWRCSLDTRIHGMLVNLAKSPNQRILQAIIELSRKHPLITLRQLCTCVTILEDDASSVTNGMNDKRGRVQGSKTGPIYAEVDHANIKVTFSHWGYSFTEPIWNFILEIITSLHKEVVFSSCGIKLGILELFGMFIKLIATQKNIKCEQNVTRLSAKFVTFVSSFKELNKSAFESWLESHIEGIPKWGTVKKVLEKCEIEIEAMEEKNE